MRKNSKKKGTADEQPNPFAELRRRTLNNELANHYHHGDPVQLYTIPLETVGYDEAEDLIDEIISGDSVSALVRLIVGIASYEDHESRQIITARAVHRAFMYTKEGTQALKTFVTDIQSEFSEGAQE